VSGVISNTSPQIAFQQLGHLRLLGTLFGTVLAPPAVRSGLRMDDDLYESALLEAGELS
jgi:hypothetical protein